jgi:hypothetical protein
MLREAGPGRFMTWTCDAIGRLMSIGAGRLMIATEDTVVGIVTMEETNGETEDQGRSKRSV